jgi:hypothetical protein
MADIKNKKVKLLTSLNEYPEDFGLKENRMFLVVDTFKSGVWVRAHNDRLVFLYPSEFMFLDEDKVQETVSLMGELI